MRAAVPEHLDETVLVDPERTFMNISGAANRENPFRYCEYIPTEAAVFVRTVAILGGESSGKSTLVNKLANIFTTTSVRIRPRLCLFASGRYDEMALQHSTTIKCAGPRNIFTSQ